MGLNGPPDVEKMKANHDSNGLIKALNYQALYQVRRAAAEALGKSMEACAVGPLIAALKDEEVGTEAARALGKIGDASAIVPLIIALKDGNPDVRQAAAWVLRKLGDGRAVEPLIAALKDKDRKVRLYVVDALDKLGWYPARDETGVWYWAAKEQWDQCTEIGASAIQPLITCLILYDQDLARSAAHTLVNMYRTGSLGEAKKILFWPSVA